jgi:hypothetical protein
MDTAVYQRYLGVHFNEEASSLFEHIGQKLIKMTITKIFIN